MTTHALQKRVHVQVTHTSSNEYSVLQVHGIVGAVYDTIKYDGESDRGLS